MRYSLKFSVLVCLVNIFEVSRCLRTAEAHSHSELHEENDAVPRRNNDAIIISAKGSGCDRRIRDSDSSDWKYDSESIELKYDRDSSDSKYDNEILIDNTKHFHEHTSNYLLIGLGEEEEDHGRCGHGKRNGEEGRQLSNEDQKLESNDEDYAEGSYDDSHHAAIGETDSTDDPRLRNAKVVAGGKRLPLTSVTKTLSRSKLDGGRRVNIPKRTGNLVDDQHDTHRESLKKSRYAYVTEPKADLEDHWDLYEDLENPIPRGKVQQSKYRYVPERTATLEEDWDLHEDLEDPVPRGKVRQSKYRYVPESTATLEEDWDIDDDLVNTPRGKVQQSGYIYVPDRTRKREEKHQVNDDSIDELDNFDELV